MNKRNRLKELAIRFDNINTELAKRFIQKVTGHSDKAIDGFLKADREFFDKRWQNIEERGSNSKTITH